MRRKSLLAGLYIAAGVLSVGTSVEAKSESGVIEKGIYIGNIDVSGMNTEQATEAVNGYVNSLLEKEITLVAYENNTVSVTAEDLGLVWTNPEVIEDATSLGKSGNILERYKIIQDLQNENLYLDIQLEFDSEKVSAILDEQCVSFDVEAKDATITRENDSFVVTEGQAGIVLDGDASFEVIMNSLDNGWDDASMDTIQLVAEVSLPKATTEDLQQIQDLLGSYSTSFKSSGAARTANVTNGGSKINGSIIMPDEEFSVYNTVKPFSEANGYYMAGSYLNGQVVDSIGGGICQVSTTLYNAVLQAELDVTMRYNHSMKVSYVEPAFDAAIAESSGKDFTFVNNTGYPIYIECYVQNKVITMNIYGVETRPANREVIYENKVLSTTQPDHEEIYPNAGLPAGYVDVTSAHIGCKAELWKIVKVDGVEQSREQVNTSTYKVSPRSCVVGIATTNVDDYNQLQAAIASGSIDQVKAVANAIAARNAAAAQAAQDAAAAQAAQDAANQQGGY